MNQHLERLRQMLRREPNADERQRIRAAAIADAYRNVFNSPEGELVLKDLLRKADLLSATAGDEAEVGRRQVALHILAMMGWSETELLRFHQQQADDAMREALWAQEQAA